jgi:hypothetical protein
MEFSFFLVKKLQCPPCCELCHFTTAASVSIIPDNDRTYSSSKIVTHTYTTYHTSMHGTLMHGHALMHGILLSVENVPMCATNCSNGFVSLQSLHSFEV